MNRAHLCFRRRHQKTQQVRLSQVVRVEDPVPAGIKWGHWRGPRSSSDTRLRADQSQQRCSRDAGPEGDLVVPRWGAVSS